MTLQRLHALATGNDHTHALVLNFLAQYTRDFRHVFGNGHHHFQVLIVEAEAPANGFKLVGSCRILPASHSRCQVVAYDHSYIGVLVDGIEQSCHTRVGEG